MAETETLCSKAACCQCGPRPVRQQTTRLQSVSVPSRRDASQIRVRCVSESHPTLVSQGFRRLALLGSATAPLYHSSLKMVLHSKMPGITRLQGEIDQPEPSSEHEFYFISQADASKPKNTANRESSFSSSFLNISLLGRAPSKPISTRSFESFTLAFTQPRTTSRHNKGIA